jgi:hypothetical protein
VANGARRARIRAALLIFAAASAGCGPSAEIASLTPSEVMSVSAWLTASVTGAMSARAIATEPDGRAVRTPDLPLLGDGVTVALLGLAPDTDYQVVVEAVPASGEAVASKPMAFHTGSLPSGLPVLTAQNGGIDRGALTLLGVVNVGGASHAAMIADADGRVVWYHVTDRPVTDFQRQPDGTYTACEIGPVTPPAPERCDQFDREGRLLRIWTAPPESPATDTHELRILDGGDALLMGSQAHPADFSAVGGSASAQAMGQVVYRLGPGGEQRFRWSAFDHLAFDDVDPAVLLSQDPVDWTHADAVSQTADGNYLVTFRNLSQVVKIDAATGAILWRLGGRRSSFTFPDDPLVGPSFQHGARELPDGHILLFDNGNGRPTRQSRAVEYALDLQRMEARVAWQYAPAAPAWAADFGFAQRLPNGNTLVSLGSLARVEEVTPAGQVVWSVESPNAGLGIYRAIRIDTLY